jgi:methyl-accepting chemotaxis protein
MSFFKKPLKGVAMPVFKNASLKLKIMCMTIIPIALLCPVFLTIYLQGTQNIKDERNNAMDKANTIAFDSAINGQKKHLEKHLTNVLITDELITFSLNPQDAGAKLVVEGIFLSLIEENIIRFSIYSADKEMLFEQVKGLPSRPRTLPAAFSAKYDQAAKDFGFHYYFRGTEDGMPSSPVEFCILAAVTDDDDKVVSFVELAVKSSLWSDTIAKLTQCTVFLYDPKEKTLPAAESKGIVPALAAAIPANINEHAFVEINVKDQHLLINIIRILGISGQPVGDLLVSTDASALVKAEKKRWVIGLSLTALIIFVSLTLAYFLVSKGITTPIKRIILFATSLAKGDVSTTLDIQTSGEIQKMTDALNAMAAHIRKRASQVEKIANGDLSVQITEDSDKDILGASLAAITSQIGEVIKQIGANSRDLLDESHKVASLSTTLQSSSDIIASQTHNLAETFSSLNNSLEIVANSTKEMSASINEISQASAEGSEMTKKANESSVAASKVMEQLKDVVSSISQANQAIRDFADQTNLLALNATIEAARAGEAGKGFAVVATEVKGLASKSMDTAKIISLDVENVARYTSDAVSSTKSIAEVIALARDSAFGIASAVEEQAAVAEDISHNISNAHTLTSGFSRNIDDLNHAASVTNESTVSLNYSAEQLSAMSEALKKSVEKFTLR